MKVLRPSGPQSCCLICSRGLQGITALLCHASVHESARLGLSSYCLSCVPARPQWRCSDVCRADSAQACAVACAGWGGHGSAHVVSGDTVHAVAHFTSWSLQAADCSLLMQVLDFRPGVPRWQHALGVFSVTVPNRLDKPVCLLWKCCTILHRYMTAPDLCMPCSLGTRSTLSTNLSTRSRGMATVMARSTRYSTWNAACRVDGMLQCRAMPGL